MSDNDKMVSAGEEEHRAAYMGGVFIIGIIVVFLVARFSTYLRRKQPKKPARPSREGVEFDLSDLFGPRDLELGIVRPDRARLPDPDMFVISDDDVKGKSKAKGKGKAQEVANKSSSFDLSYYFSPLVGSPALLRVDSVLPALPQPVMTREHHDHSFSGRVAYTGSATIPGPSRLANPSRFMIIDSDISSEEEKDVNRWKTTLTQQTPPKVSRYRGLSATRPAQKPLAPSRGDGPAPLPVPETSYFGSKRDSWEDFGSDSEAGTYVSNEWTSEVITTLTDNNGNNNNDSNNNDNDNSKKAVTETVKNTSGSTGGQYPAWVLEQKASLAGRIAKFSEVEVDGSTIEAPGESSDVFKECLGLLREGARSPTILTTYGYNEQRTVRPEMARISTWGWPSALFKRNSRPQAAARSKTSQL